MGSVFTRPEHACLLCTSVMQRFYQGLERKEIIKLDSAVNIDRPLSTVKSKT